MTKKELLKVREALGWLYRKSVRSSHICDTCSPGDHPSSIGYAYGARDTAASLLVELCNHFGYTTEDAAVFGGPYNPKEPPLWPKLD